MMFLFLSEFPDVRTNKFTHCQATGELIKTHQEGWLIGPDPSSPRLWWVRFVGLKYPYKLIKTEDLEDL